MIIHAVESKTNRSRDRRALADGARDRHLALTMALLLFLVYAILASLHIDSGDGAAIYWVTRSIAEEASCAIPPPAPDAVVVGPFGEPISPADLHGGGPYGAWGVDGRYYAQYGLGQSLLALPLYWTGRALHALTGWATAVFATRCAVTLLNPLALALAGGCLYLLARRLDYGRRAAVGVALTTGLATPLWVYSKTFFSEPLLTLALVAATLGALQGDRGRAGGWVVCGLALGAAALVKPVSVVSALAFLAYAALRRRGRWRAVALASAPLVLGVAAVGAYNSARFGSPFDMGYRTAAWDGLPWVGAAGLLVSSGKGLLWYCPPLVLGLAGFFRLGRRWPRTAALLGGTFLLYLSAHVSYNHWHGGGAWGPRLILPVVPLLILPAAEWMQNPPRREWIRLLMAAALAAGVIVQVPAVLVNPARTLQALYDRSASPTEYTLRLLYRPADSPLVGQWRSLFEVAALMRDRQTRAAVVETALAAAGEGGGLGDPLTEAVGLLSFNAFDVWPVTWALLGTPVAPLVIVESVLVGLAAGTARRLRERAT